jgi:dehydrogenase/reductase SDR family protein 7
MLARHKGLFLTLGAIAIPTGIMLKSDSDLCLKFASDPPAKANSGKVVWIVGASSGIGASLAVDFARDGANVIISARREAQLKEVAANCMAAGGKSATVLPLDVTHFQDHQKAFDQVLKEFGKVDILVLNAGISQRNFAAETPFEVTQQIINTNFLSYASLTRCVLPSMIEKKQGKIVVMSSLAGLMGLPISSSYSASKFALVGLLQPVYIYICYSYFFFFLTLARLL